MIQIKRMKIGRSIEAIIVVAVFFLLVGTASAQECEGLGRPLRGLCKAYCDFLDCDDTGTSRICGPILRWYTWSSGGELPPCLQPERCVGQTCATYTFDCNPENDQCACVTIAEGGGSCVANESCSGLLSCKSSSECDAGYICAVQTCCGAGGVCLVDNNCLGSPQRQNVEGEGPTLFGN